MDVRPDLRPVVVQKPDGVEIRKAVARHVLDEHFPRIARADDQRVFPLPPGPLLPENLHVKLLGNPQAGNERQREEPVHQEDPLGQPRDRQMEKTVGQTQDQQRHLGHDNRQDDVHQLRHAHVAPRDPVNAENREEADLQNHKEDKDFPQQLRIRHLQIEVEMNEEREEQRKRGDEDVGQQKKQKAAERRRMRQII